MFLKIQIIYNDEDGKQVVEKALIAINSIERVEDGHSSYPDTTYFVLANKIKKGKAKEEDTELGVFVKGKFDDWVAKLDAKGYVISFK